MKGTIFSRSKKASSPQERPPIERKTSKISKKMGLPPGVLVYIGDIKEEHTHISIIDYNGESIKEHKTRDVEHCYPMKDSQTISWINVDGLEDVKTIELLGHHFGLDNLLLEDVVNTEQRPKVEVFEDHAFFALKMLSYNEKTRKIDVEQVSFILGSNYVISFQEQHGDVFEPVRKRLRKSWGSIRYRGSDYLVYSLIDVIIDNYFFILESLGAEIEDIEDQVLHDTREELIKVIQQNKKQIQILQKSIRPLREAINKLYRNESNLIEERTLKFFNDVYDHTVQVIESIESYRDMNMGIQDIYLSSLSHKMNQVIQVLTIISTIFIPLTFLTGFYGMNFSRMPGLDSYIGFYLMVGLMLGVTFVLLLYFRRKNWI